jgi:hypothetical protein
MSEATVTERTPATGRPLHTADGDGRYLFEGKPMTYLQLLALCAFMDAIASAAISVAESMAQNENRSRWWREAAKVSVFAGLFLAILARWH